MYYAQARADWLAPRLVRRPVYRGIRAGLLTLGHLRTLEVAGNPLATAGDRDSLTAYDLGQVLAASRLPWRAFRTRYCRASVLLRMDTGRCTPRTEEEVDVFFQWYQDQTFAPPSAHMTAAEQQAAAMAAARASDHAATPAMRTAAALTSVPGWDRVLGIPTPWDAPLIAASHLLLASAENAGACHFSADLMEG